MLEDKENEEDELNCADLFRRQAMQFMMDAFQNLKAREAQAHM